jgi:type II secretory pathway pseudopilin PulG
MKYNKSKLNNGFTLVETLIAILILTLSIGALLSLAAAGFYSVRYSRNQIVANNLLQESIEYIRNTRDTSFQQGGTWVSWQNDILSVDVAGNSTGTGTDGCFSANGCYIDPYTTDTKIKQCDNTQCPFVLYYPDNSFYGYNATYPFITNVTAPFKTSFVRTIKIKPSIATPDQLVLTANISWLNGTSPKQVSQTILIANWRQ